MALNIPFNQNDPDPQTSCHFDMAQGYSSSMAASAIEKVRMVRGGSRKSKRVEST
jgi:hypothetical protein